MCHIYRKERRFYAILFEKVGGLSFIEKKERIDTESILFSLLTKLTKPKTMKNKPKTKIWQLNKFVKYFLLILVNLYFILH